MLKEFRPGVGYFYEDTKNGKVLIWHRCANTPMCFLIDRFDFEADYAKACRRCGQTVTKWEVMCCYDQEEDDENNTVYLQFLNIDLIRIKTDDLSIGVGVFESAYNLWRGTAVFKKSTYHSFCSINIKTGYTYRFAKKKPGKQDAHKGMENICYQGAGLDFILPDDALLYLCDEINQKMKAFHGIDVPSFESYGLELTFDNLIFYVRCPYMNPLLYHDMINISRCDGLNPPRHKDLIVKSNCRDPLRQILSQSRIPNVKSLKRIFYGNITWSGLLVSICRSFQNVDIIRSLYLAFLGCGENEYGCYHYIDFSAKIFKTMIKHKGEQIVASKILSFKRYDKNNNTFRTLSDMIRCYDELKSCDFDFTKRYDIDELHLYLAKSVAKQKSENRKIPYADNEIGLETSDGIFALSLARDTHELADVGMQMEICVESYANEAVSKRCAIMILRGHDRNEPVGCIELHGDTVIQVKEKQNKLLDGQKKEFIEKWIADKGLTVGTNDLQNTEIVEHRRRPAEKVCGDKKATIDYNALRMIPAPF